MEEQTFRIGDRVVLDAHLRRLYPDIRPVGVVVTAEPVEGLVPVRPDGCLTTCYLNPAHLRRGADAALDTLPPESHAPQPIPENPARHLGRPRFRKGALRRWREWVRGSARRPGQGGVAGDRRPRSGVADVPVRRVRLHRWRRRHVGH